MPKSADVSAPKEERASVVEGRPSVPGRADAPDGEGFEAQVARYARRQRGWRSPTLMVLVIGICGWLMWSMKSDLSYFLSSPTPIHLGDEEEYDLSVAEENAFVKIEGLPSILQAQYKQLGTQYRVFFLLGTRVFVREPLAEVTPSGEDHPVFVGSGRLIDLNADRSFANLRAFFRENGRIQFSEPAWMLLSGVEPRQEWWIPAAYVLLGGILLLNLGILGRRLILRR